MDFQRLASGASGVSWPLDSCHGRLNLSDHRCLHRIRRSLLLRLPNITQQFQKNPYHNDKDLISEQ